MNDQSKGFFSSPMVKAGVVLGLAMIVGAAILSYAAVTIIYKDNTLAVVGSAKKPIVSDSAKWYVSFSRQATYSTLKGGYDQMGKDLQIVKDYFVKNGFQESDLTISTVYMDEVYEQNPGPADQKKYNLRQSVEVASKDIEKISAMSKNYKEIVEKGVIFNANQPSYLYSGLSDLRVSLLADAIKDAKNRADSIASVSGNSVGDLKSAGSGVVQVLSPGSVDVSDYGTYDTASINKEVMVTVRASFYIK